MIRRVLGVAMLAFGGLGALAVPAAGAGGGIPVPYVNGEHGIAAPGGGHRYVVLAGTGETTVARIAADSGRVMAYTTLDRGFTLPAVAFDGTPGGLSPDGQTLVLVNRAISFGQHTHLAVLGGRKLRVEDRVHLGGNFNVDAISPDGSTIYLIQYLSRVDPTRYAVRAYDVQRERMLPKPIVDPDEHAGEMRGTPVTRAYSPDGRWAYTLYDGGDEPFVHALDTVAGKAVCIDLPGFKNYKLTTGKVQLSVAADGSHFDLIDRGSPVATVDTQSFKVSTPSAAGDSGGGLPWSVIGLALGGVAVAAAALSLTVRRRHRPPVAGDVT